MPFPELAPQAALKVALDGGGADAFPPSQPAAVHTVEVLLVDGLLEGFAGSLIGQDAGHSLARVSPALQTLRLGDPQSQHVVAQSPILMPYLSLDPAFIAQSRSPTMRAPSLSDVPGRDFDISTGSANLANLEIRQA